MEARRVGVLGLGKLGLPLALVLSAAGHDVKVYDVDPTARNAVYKRESHINEPGVQDMLGMAQFELALSPREMVQCDITFIIVPTPSTLGGPFDTAYVEDAIKSIGTGGWEKHPVVAVVSTVSPGACRNVLLPIAHEHDLDLVYTPTMIALGTVIRDLRHPAVQLIGYDSTNERSVEASLVARAVLRSFAPDAAFAPMSYDSAELTKLSANVYTTLKIDFANLLGRMCMGYPAADVDDITSALGLNPIIAPKALVAGAGYGGPCFPRDAYAFAAAGGSLGTVVHALNQEHATWVAEYAITHFHMAMQFWPQSFYVLGRGYKEESEYRIESFGDRLVELFINNRLLEADMDCADVVVLAQQLRDYDLRGRFKKDALVFDLWRTHMYLKEEKGITYIPFGIGT